MTPHPTLPLNVLQVIPELETGGAERTTVDIARGIIEAGGKALVATRGGRLQGEIETLGGLVFNLPVHSKNPLVILANVRRLRRIIRAHDVKIVHARSRAPAWSALRAARAEGIAYVTTYHGTYKARSAAKSLYNSGMARGDVVIANSHFIADRIRAEHPGLATRLEVIYRGTDLAAYDELNVDAGRRTALLKAWGLEDNHDPLVLLPGRLTEWKGQRILIEAVDILKARGQSGFKVVLAGDHQGREDYLQSLWSAIRSHGLEGRVRLVGHCDDIPAACAVSDIVVSASTEPEAFGRIAVEAQAMGRVIIASSHGGAAETVVPGGPDRTGWHVRPGSAEDLANAIEEALALGPQGRRGIGKHGRLNAARFSVGEMISQTLQVYRRLLSR